MNIQASVGIYDPNASECLPILSYDATTVIAILASVLGILWMGYNILMLRRIDLSEVTEMEGEEGLIEDMPEEQKKVLQEFGYKTYDAALAFLKLEYLFCIILVIIAFLLLFFLTDLGSSAAIPFLIGSLISIFSSVCALILTTRAFPRVAYCCKYGLGPTFRTAYQCCTAIGFGVTSFNLLGITVSIWIFKQEFSISNTSMTPDYFYSLFEAVAGYGLGASMVALITRVGGGMFEATTEAGSQLVGKAEGALPFTHSRNAATIGVHAGHHVQGIVGAGSDLLGSYTQLTCVAFLLGSNTLVGWQGQSQPCAANLATIVFPLTVLSFGLIVSLGVSVVGVLVAWVESRHQLITTIRFQRLISGLLMAGALYLACFLSFPSQFRLMGIFDTLNNVHAPWQVYLCALVGNIAYIVLALFGEFATAPNYPFVQKLAGKCRKGPAAGVTLGLAFGYLGSCVPTTIVCLTAFYGFQFLGFFGIAVTILGILCTFPIQLALQTLSPVAVNASTSVKVANLGEEEKDTSTLLQNSGLTAASVSRSVSLGCSALVGLTLFGGFLRNASLDGQSSENLISLTNPIIFAGLLVGAIFPFIIAGLTIRGSRKATTVLAFCVQTQLRQDDAIARQQAQVDYGGAVHPASLKIIKHIILPVFLVVVLPFLLGLAISAQIVAGMLIAVIVSGTLFSSSAVISGQALQSTKRLIESGTLTDEQGAVHGVGSVAHKAALIGNSVGYVLKKNAGCSITASIKLMGMLAVLFGGQFAQLHELI